MTLPLSEERGTREAKAQARLTKFMSVFLTNIVLGNLTQSNLYVGDISDILWQSTVLSELWFTPLEMLGTQSVNFFE